MIDKKNFLGRTALSTGAASLALGFAIAATPVAAQTAPNSVGVTPTAAAGATADSSDVIVVTGSRIARRDLESASPIAVVKAEEFKLAGAVNVEQVLNQLPQVYPATTSASNNPGGGVATLDLRGLGPTRTLVLVNGRRWMFYDVNQIVDLNTIPSFLLDSVDVVSGGASAVYGSDAVAGVVNFRLKKLNGLEAGGQYSLTEKGDGRRYDGHLAIGAESADGRGYVVAYGQYYKRKEVFAGARDFSRFSTSQFSGVDVCVDPGTINRYGVGTVVGEINQEGATAGSCDTGVPGFGAAGSGTNQLGRFRYTGSGGPQGFFNSNGALFPTPGAQARRYNGTLDSYNFAPENYLQVPQERWLLGGYGEYEVVDGVTGYAEVSYVNNRVTTSLAATPVTGTFNYNIDQTCTFINAVNCAQLRSIDAAETGVAGNDGIVRLSTNRRTLEAGQRLNEDERNAFRVLVGVKGDISSWLNYDAYYLFARTRNSQTQTGGISRSAFQAGLDGTGTPINIFGPGTLTPAMVQQITASASNTDVSQLQVASGSLTGRIGNLGLGGDDIGLAVGVEYRSVNSRFAPDPVSASGDIIGPNFGQATAGRYNVLEGFAELRVPIVADRPFFHRLEATAAARYSDYSLGAVGGVWTYAGGVEWAPIKDITFRGQYQRSIRAPNVGDLFGGTSNGFPSATDPCAQASAATNATIRTLCIQTGVPPAFVGNALVQTQSQIEALFGGNPDLQEETSDTYTAGVVLRPSFIPRLNVTVDYYKIKIKGAIINFGGGLNNVLDVCYNREQDINSVYCQTFIGARDPATGEIANPFVPNILQANSGLIETRGIDLGVDYTQPLNFNIFGSEGSKLNFSFLLTYLERYNFQPAPELPDLLVKCKGKFGIGFCGNPYAEFKWTSRLTYVDGPVSLSARWRHVSSVRDDQPEAFYTVEKIKAYNLVDLTVSYDIGDHFNMSVGVNNLLAKNPPQLGTNAEQSNTYPGTYDTLGRDFFVSFGVRF